MSSIPLPALHIQPPEQPDLLGQYGKAMSIKNAQQQGQINQQKLQENAIGLQQAQQQQKDQQAFRQAMADPSMQGKTIGEVADALAKSGNISVKSWQEAKKSDLEHRKDLAGLDEKTLANRKAAHDATEQLYGNVMNMDDQQLAQNWPAVAQQYNSIPGNDKLPMNPQQPMSKQQLAQFGPMIGMGNTYFEQELARREKTNKFKGEQADTQIKQGEAANMQQYGTKEQRKEVPGVDVPFSPEVQKQKIQIAQQSRPIIPGASTGDIGAPDPNSPSILAQTGLSLPAFYTLTGQASKLPRDAASRQRAFNEAQQFANKRGVDVSTLGSQYTAYNETLNKNIQRLNNTKIMEQEIQGTVQNLQSVVNQKDLGRVNVENVVKIWAGQQVNDPLAQQYALHLGQLRNELTAYYAATQGRSGNQIMISDERDAAAVLRNGLSTGSLRGLSTAIDNSTKKMGIVMQGSVERSQAGVWGLFGVKKPGGAAQGGVSVTDPRGGVHNFPNQQAADAFKKAAGIQ